MPSILIVAFAACLALASGAAAHPHEPGGMPGYGFHRFERFLPGPGRLGVQLQDMTPELREFLRAPKEHGVLVVRVEPDSAADRAGVRVGDVIVSAGGEEVAETNELIRSVFTAEKDAKLPLEVVRDGAKVSLEAKLEGEPAVAGRPMKWMEERMPEIRAGLEARMKELERRLEELERQLKEALPKGDGDEIDT
jgi:membrane-associated protease RseP (regulator of RpoE activity)